MEANYGTFTYTDTSDGKKGNTLGAKGGTQLRLFEEDEDIDKTLEERNKTHGSFTHNASLAQVLKNEMRRSRNWNTLRPVQREALEMIAHKIARILCGDPFYKDSWRDIAGYARLVERELEKR